MAFDKTPEDAETGTFEDTLADTDATEEVWIEHEGKHYGFQIIPAEEVPWAKKSAIVEDAASREGGFSAVEYFKEILKWQIQETSFGAEERFETWFTAASTGLVEKLEEYAPEPHGEAGRDVRVDAALNMVDAYLSDEGDETATVEEFRAWLTLQSEGEEGK